jgi:hypothetical protein
MAGVPGTGLGGIFYVLLVIWMVLRESWLLAAGLSSPGRWVKIAWLGSLAGTIVTALWAEALALKDLIGPASVLALNEPIGPAPVATRINAVSAAFAIDALIPSLAVVPFAVLAILLLSLHLAKFMLRSPH